MTFFEYLDNEYTRLTFEMRESFDIVKQAETKVIQSLVDLIRRWLRFKAYFRVVAQYLWRKLFGKFPEKVDLKAMLDKTDPGLETPQKSDIN